MAIGQDFYSSGDNIANLNNLQATQSQFAGSEGARLADPFLPNRQQYGTQLNNLMANPGDFASSPVYKFAYDQGLGALQASEIARGRSQSGNAMRDLMDYGQGKASQLYFPQADLLAKLSGATTGSPAAAGMSYVGGVMSGQDRANMAAAARGNAASPTGSTQQPWWMNPNLFAGNGSTGGGNPGSFNATGGYGMPSGNALPSGGTFPSYGGYGGQGGSVSAMSPTQLNAEASLYGFPTIPYQPGYGLPGTPQKGNTGYSYNPNGASYGAGTDGQTNNFLPQAQIDPNYYTNYGGFGSGDNYG